MFKKLPIEFAASMTVNKCIKSCVFESPLMFFITVSRLRDGGAAGKLDVESRALVYFVD